MESSLEFLKAWSGRYGMIWPSRAQERFERYIELLLRYQKTTNLTGFGSARALERHLFADSLEILRAGELGRRVLDVGAGAGFPSIPIKIMRPDLSMCLVEPRAKRYAFLQLVVRELGLSEVEVIRANIESVETGKVDTALSKAFLPICDWLSLGRRWAESGARIGCYVSQADWQRHWPSLCASYALDGMVASQDRVYALVSLKAP